MQAMICIALATLLGGQAASDGWADLRQHIGAAVFVHDTSDEEVFDRLTNVTADALSVDVHGDTRSILKVRACEVALIRRDRSVSVAWSKARSVCGRGSRARSPDRNYQNPPATALYPS
jgi:hypothetical protein